MDYKKIYSDFFESQNQESLETYWLSDTFKIIPKPVYRLESQANRFYYTIDSGGVEIGCSATQFIGRVLHPNFLMQWYKENTEEFINKRMLYSSNYGTASHIIMGLFIKFGKIEISSIPDFVNLYWDNNNLEECTEQELGTKKEWIQRLENDLICVLSFMQEKEFKPLAVEYMAFYSADEKIPFNFGCAIDLVGTLKFRNKEVMVIVDYKTGGIYDSHIYQLIANKLAWEQNNPDFPIEMAFNLSPKNSTSKKKYELKNQDIDSYMERFNCLVGLAKYENFNPKPIKSLSELSIDSSIDKIYLEPEEYIKLKHGETK